MASSETIPVPPHPVPPNSVPPHPAQPSSGTPRTGALHITPAWSLPLPILAAVALILLGISSIWPTALTLYAMWVNDPLKSIGMLVPIASLVLILRAWRALGWELRGSWWGLALLLATAAAVRFREQSVLVLILSPRWSIYFPPHSLVALSYLTGAVLLFGGFALLRAARFPVLLILLTNPVPHIFNVFVDLPLQRVSAHVARAFAIALHQKLTPDQMRLMFTPDFGMFIAPGCNGIRGAVTMGMIALVTGYLYRFRWRAHLAFVVGAVLLGYVFNFVRLCTLVLYYIAALKVPGLSWLQERAEIGDYVIGAALFLVAIGLLFWVIRHVTPPTATIAPASILPATPPAGTALRFVAMLLLCLASTVHMVQARTRANQIAGAHLAPTSTFPATVGPYHLDRTWSERMTGGPVLFDWAQYTPPPQTGSSNTQDTAVEDAPSPISIGLSPTLGSHDASICHSARGEDPIWHGELETPTAAGSQTFSSSFFNNGATQYLELSTVCTATGCGEYTAGNTHFGLIYTHALPADALTPGDTRPIPVMLRIETLNTSMPADLARAELTTRMRDFLAHADLLALTRPAR